MDIRKLEAFCKVYELRSFSKAGQELFLSQPTISSHISHLESELDVQLFDRLGRRTLPTQPAEILYEYATEAFRTLDDARSEIQLLRDKVVGDLVLGGSTIPATYILPRLIAGFAQKHPGVSYSLSVGDTESIVRQVIDGDFVFGLVGAKPDARALTSLPLLEDDMVVVASREFAETIKHENRPWSIPELTQLPWVMREKGSGTQKSFENAVRGHVFLHEFDVRAMVGSTQAVVEFVLSGVGISTTSALVARPYLERGELVTLQVPDLYVKRKFYLTYLKDRKLFPALQAFIRFAQYEAQNIF